MKSIFVDTSAWVALFVKNDENHKKAVKIFEKIKKNKLKLYTSDYIIDETITTILYKGNHSQSVQTADALLKSSLIDIVYITEEIFLKTLKTYKKYKDKKFSFTDVNSFTIMKDLGISKAFSFDNDFVQAGYENLK